MPRTVSFAFANAAHSLMVERQEDREGIHTYYTAPEKYLETRRNWPRSFANRSPCSRTWTRDRTRRSAIATASTMTARRRPDRRAPRDRPGPPLGVRRARDDDRCEGDRRQSHRRVARRLLLERQALRGAHPVQTRRGRRVRLRLELAESLARELNEEYTDSFRSKVIYNVDRLGPGGKGYIEREEHGKSYRTRLSRIGELWVRAHSDDESR